MVIGSFAALLNGEFTVAGGDRRFVSSLVVRVRVCACARWVTLMVYFLAMELPGGGTGAVVLLVVLVAEKIGFRQCVLAVWKVVSALFSVP